MTEKEMIEIKHGSENICDLLNQEQTELKKAMIEELGNTLYCKRDKFDLSNPFEVAKAVIEEGCIKIPEGAIVIDKDYLNLLKQTVAAHTRKETAMEFADKMKLKCKELENKYSHLCKSKRECLEETCRYEGVLAVKRELYELAKQFGVEVEE